MRSLLRPTSSKRVFFFIVADLVLSLITFFAAYELRFNFHVEPEFFDSFWMAYLLLVALKIGSLFFFKSYFVVWRFFGFADAKNIIKAHIVAYGIYALILLFSKDIFAPFPRSVIIIDFFLSLFVIGFLRILKRLLIEGHFHTLMKPTLIVGVGSGASSVIRNAMDGEIPYYPVAIVALKQGKYAVNGYINNLKIYDFEALEKLIEEKGVRAAIIARNLSQEELKSVADRLNTLGVTEIKQVRFLGSQYDKLEDLSIEDLLARHPQDLDQTLITSFVKDKRILITGAGGSIGSEIARQCVAYGAEHLTLVDNSEYNLYQIGETIPEAILSLTSVTDTKGLRELYAKEKPQIVIHAAAYKHVPICETNINAAVVNNVAGGKSVIDVSIEYAVQKVVIVSTDKAVRPTNVMGATKRVIELYANNVDSEETEIVAVRFGNVLGSSGSVIPKFKRQIEEGGPVTVTHPKITRYFMLVTEACQLVLQAAAIAKGRELFILDMGKPVRIVDLAEQMIRLYGKANEVEIIYTGLRPGEKLYEELLLEESDQPTSYRSIFIAEPTEYDIRQLNEDIETLLEAKDKIAALQNIVPEFIRKNTI